MRLKRFVVESADTSYKGFLVKTRALYCKDVLNRLQADLVRVNAYYLDSLNLSSLLDYINEKAGVGYANFGKIVICVIVLILFKLVSVVLFTIMKLILEKILKFFIKGSYAENIEEVFIHKLRRPIQAFMFVFTIGLCAAILYYPNSINIGVFKLLNFCYIWIIAWLVISVLSSYGVLLVSKLAIKSGKKEIINLVIRILYAIICLIALLICLKSIGFNISTLIASLGIGGFAVALASKDMLSNFFASMQLLFDDSFEQGDWVKIGNIQGKVVETGLSKTSIRSFDNTLIFMPNSAIMSQSIENFKRRKLGRRVKTYIGIDNSIKAEDLRKLSDDIKILLKNSPHVAKIPEQDSLRGGLLDVRDLEGYKDAVYVCLSDFDEYSANLYLSFYTARVDGLGHRLDKEEILLEVLKLIEDSGASLSNPIRKMLKV